MNDGYPPPAINWTAAGEARRREITRIQNRARGVLRGLRPVVFERDGYACQHCGLLAAPQRFDETHQLVGVGLVVDHVIPLARGGETSLENLRALCWTCNSAKAVRDRAPV